MAAELICICGPTASGKSSCAELVAHALSSDVVSVDAMQIYKGMNIGTAKQAPRFDDVRLHMVDLCDISKTYSCALYQQDARTIIDGLINAQKTPVLCGGTGLYLYAAIDKMEFPKGDLECGSRKNYEELANRLGAKGIHNVLYERDPQSAELIHVNNVRRTIRALEMLDEGKHYFEQVSGFTKHESYYQALIYALELDRTELYRRIDERVDHMIEHGLITEVESLLDQGLAHNKTAAQAIGYKELIDYFENTVTLDEAVCSIKRRTRNYAKRQISWFKRDPRVRWINMSLYSVEEAAAHIVSEYESSE